VPPVRFRRNADRLTPGQLELLREAFEALYGIADDRGYGYQAGIHGLPLPIGCDNAHGTPYFLPWHRAYLYLLRAGAARPGARRDVELVGLARALKRHISRDLFKRLADVPLTS
jgi:Common central domain of tyrosinase